MIEKNSSYQSTFCVEEKPVPNTVIIFGASGDLTKRKLIPALFSLYSRKLLHPNSSIIGCARSKMTEAEYRQILYSELKKSTKNKTNLDDFIKKIHYIQGEYSSEKTYILLAKFLNKLEAKHHQAPHRTFYLATPPTLYAQIVPQLKRHELVIENYTGMPWRHVILEKPFGKDSKSARELDKLLHENLHERQIYRIDHYLGKETVQNILMLRFANIIFNPIWNSNYIDNVQITVAEDIGVEHRAGYYDKAGLLRDMFQNHMLEMLSLVAMEMPSSFDADAIRDEKLKLIKAIRPFPIDKLNNYLIRGQYLGNDKIKAYCDETGVKENSTTETFVAAKFLIDNWRWHSVPFYLRSGKRLAKKTSSIIIQFKAIPHSIFHPIEAKDMQPDTLTLTVQPDEGLSLSIQAKQPGPKLCMGALTMGFKYKKSKIQEPLDAYGRLLLDAMLGDQTLFIRSDIITAAWQLLTPVLEAWENTDSNKQKCPCTLYAYNPSSWGPAESNKLVEQDNFSWHNL
jgi:glucose-6-phosphate 1-dehydrogenase